MAKVMVKPLIAGGRTLARMGRKGGSSGGKKNRKATWFELDGKVYGEQAKMGSWPVGETPAGVLARLKK